MENPTHSIWSNPPIRIGKHALHDLRCHGVIGHFHHLDEIDDVRAALGEADVFLLCSRIDPFPSVVLESFAMGVPVVGFDQGQGCRDLIAESGFGTLVPYQDLAGTIAAIDALLSPASAKARAVSEGGAAFVADSEQALAVRDGARSLLEQLNLRITSLRTRKREKLPDREILARAAEIGSLHQHLAVYRQWHTEQVKLRARCAQSELELRAGMRQLDIDGEPDRVESLRARSADELALEETAQALRESRQELQVSDAERARRSNELTQLRGKLSALVTVDVSALRSILAETAGAAEAAKSLPRKQVELASAESAVAVQHGRLDGAPSDSAAVFRLPVPAAATLRRFEAELARIDAAGSSTEADSREAGDRVQEIAGQLQRLGRRGDLPSIAALQQARRLRDQGWEQVLAAWKGEAEEVELDGRPLAEAYSLSV